MKKWIKTAAFTAIALIAFSIFAIGQDTATADTTKAVVETASQAVETPAVPMDTTNPLLEFFFSYAGLVLLIQIVTGWILKTLPMLGKTLKQVTSWIVAIGVSYIGKMYGFGLFADASTIQTIATGVGLGMVANYLYDAKTLESILSIFFATKKP